MATIVPEPNAFALATEEKRAVTRNLAELPWVQYPGHFNQALSKAIVTPATVGSRFFDHRISSYEPMAYVARHKHKVQEQVYHVLEGEGLFEFGNETRVVRRHDVIFIPPGVEHAFTNTGLDRLVFLVVTSPISDE